jgi:hypothetical protein
MIKLSQHLLVTLEAAPVGKPTVAFNLKKVMITPKRTPWDAVAAALFDSDMIAARLTLATAELFWGIMLFWVGETFSRPTYHIMAHLMPEECWASVFIISCVLQTTIVLRDNYDDLWPKYFAGFNAALWCFVVISMLLSIYPPPAAVGGEIALSIVATWIFARPFVLAEGYKRATRRL